MFNSDQYQQEAEKYRRRADGSTKPSEVAEFRALERSFDTLADNARWLAEHQDGIVPVTGGGRGHESDRAAASSMSLSSEHVAANSHRGPSCEFYQSSNGDKWALIPGVETGEVRVRHNANPASGGHVTETDLRDFLTRGNSPEQQGLLRLISRLAF